jgi:hypothetical protein
MFSVSYGALVRLTQSRNSLQSLKQINRPFFRRFGLILSDACTPPPSAGKRVHARVWRCRERDKLRAVPHLALIKSLIARRKGVH